MRWAFAVAQACSGINIRAIRPTSRPLCSHAPLFQLSTIRRFVVMTLTRQIATHDGTFHCDEALAVHMLRLTQTFQNATIVRSRDESILASADVVVDVGGIYDAKISRFDHHQRGFTGTFEEDGRRTRTKLSSAGLVYKHMGKEVIANILKSNHIELGSGEIDKVYLKVYDCFVEAVDAIDNGISQFDTDQQPRYEASTDLGSRVGRLNAAWNEPCTPEIQMENFGKAIALTGLEFDDCVLSVAKSWLPARTIVSKAMSSRFEDDEQGRLLVMREWAPWKDHVYAIEEEEAAIQGSARPVMYVVYKDMTGNSWRVQAVPVAKSSFTSRIPLPERWRGLRGDDLSTLSGIRACIFVHASGFIGGNETFKGAMEMAKMSLKVDSLS